MFATDRIPDIMEEHMEPDSAPLTTPIASLPGCGECAAYSFLRLTGVQVSLTEVSHVFRTGVSDFDPLRVSVLRIREVLAKYGIETKAVQVSGSRLVDVPLPCILYFRPGRYPGLSQVDTGHFLTVSERLGDELRAFDWSPLSVNHETILSHDRVSQAWDGEAIVRTDRWSSSWVSVMIAIGVLAVSWIVSRRNRIARDSRIPPLALLLSTLCLMAAGCGQDSQRVASPAPLLTVARPVLDLGVVSGEEAIVARFSIQVCAPVSVKITGISKSCGCTTSDDKLIGQWLAPGAQRELVLRINPKGTVAQTEIVTAELSTEPKSPVPIVVCVRYRPRKAPRVSLSHFRVEPVGNQSRDVSFDVSYQRAFTDAPSPLKVSECGWGVFQVVKVVLRTEQLTSKDSLVKLVVDRTHVILRSPMMTDDTLRHGTLTLVFDKHEVQSVPYDIVSVDPIEPVFKSVFLGKLAPNVAFSATIPLLIRTDDTKVDRVSTDEGMVATLVGRIIKVQGMTPTQSGRFTREVHIQAFGKSGSLPVITVTVSGIVENR